MENVLKAVSQINSSRRFWIDFGVRRLLAAFNWFWIGAGREIKMNQSGDKSPHSKRNQISNAILPPFR